MVNSADETHSTHNFCFAVPKLCGNKSLLLLNYGVGV